MGALRLGVLGVWRMSDIDIVPLQILESSLQRVLKSS